MDCPLCGNKSFVLFSRCQQSGSVHMSDESTRNMRMAGCSNCDFVWNADAFDNVSEFGDWINSAYTSYQLLSNDLHHFPLVDPRAEMAKSFLDSHCRWDQIHNVMEVGSNRGDFLAYLQSCNSHLNLLGVESSRLSLAGVPTLFGDIRGFNFSPSFDLIIIRQVFEHLLEPKAFLRHLASFLVQGGSLMIEVPYLENDLDEGIDPWVMEHVTHYSERSLALAGNAAGLSLVGMDRSYQLMAFFRKGGSPEMVTPLASHNRLQQVHRFCEHVEQTQQEWLDLVQQGYELCFYGASNVFLAVSGVLKKKWQESWDSTRKCLIDDYSQKHSSVVGGIRVQSWDDHIPSGKCIYIVCAMYRYHRQKMIPTVLDRINQQDKVYAMWTPQV